MSRRESLHRDHSGRGYSYKKRLKSTIALFHKPKLLPPSGDYVYNDQVLRGLTELFLIGGRRNRLNRFSPVFSAGSIFHGTNDPTCLTG